MCRTALLMMVGVLSGCASVAMAEGPGGPGRGDRGRLPDRAFAHLDANADGSIDRTEFDRQMPQLVRRIMGRLRQGRAGRGPRPGRGFGAGQGAPWSEHGATGAGRGGPGGRGIGFARRLERMIEAKVERAVAQAMRRWREHGPGRFGPARPAGPPPREPGAQPSQFRPPFPGGPRAELPARRSPGELKPLAPTAKRSRAGLGPGRGRADRSGGPRGRGRRGAPPTGQRAAGRALIETLDANRDGKIDQQEISQAAAALKKLDHNRDGVLDLDDLNAAPPRREPAAAPPSPAVKPGRPGGSRPAAPGKG